VGTASRLKIGPDLRLASGWKAFRRIDGMAWYACQRRDGL